MAFYYMITIMRLVTLTEKPCAFEKQSLIDHLVSSVNIARNFVEKYSYDKVVYNRMKYFVKGLELKHVLDGIILSVYLHDIGKGLERYQKSFDNECNSITKKYSFNNHEIFSAVIANEILNDDGQPWDELINYIILAIIMHHESMRIIDPSIKLKDKLKIKYDENLLGYKQLFENLHNLISDINLKEISKIDLNSIEYLDDRIKYISGIGSSNQIRQINRNLNLYNFFELPLIISDNFDSQRRGDDKSRRRFVNELKKEVEI